MLVFGGRSRNGAPNWYNLIIRQEKKTRMTKENLNMQPRKVFRVLPNQVAIVIN